MKSNWTSFNSKQVFLHIKPETLQDLNIFCSSQIYYNLLWNLLVPFSSSSVHSEVEMVHMYFEYIELCCREDCCSLSCRPWQNGYGDRCLSDADPWSKSSDGRWPSEEEEVPIAVLALLSCYGTTDVAGRARCRVRTKWRPCTHFTPFSGTRRRWCRRLRSVLWRSTSTPQAVCCPKATCDDMEMSPRFEY